MRISGVGLAAMISLAMDQIFCFAPSIKPDIEPVVSSTKQTSMCGLAGLVEALSSLDFDAANAWQATRMRLPARRVFVVVFMVVQWPDCSRQSVHTTVGRRLRQNAPDSLYWNHRNFTTRLLRLSVRLLRAGFLEN